MACVTTKFKFYFDNTFQVTFNNTKSKAIDVLKTKPYKEFGYNLTIISDILK